MWHVSSRSGVATLRTLVIHLLYACFTLVTYLHIPASLDVNLLVHISLPCSGKRLVESLRASRVASVTVRTLMTVT